ncbi:terminase subunit nuclease and ATPase [Klebsiella phage CPRSB]|nr:terminase subunit nuclease and ATPase [Klebsiella phage CPRSB]
MANNTNEIRRILREDDLRLANEVFARERELLYEDMLCPVIVTSGDETISVGQHGISFI